MLDNLTKKLEEFQRFKKENPLGFDKEEQERILLDIIEPRNGVVSDEYVDFILWCRGLKTRQDSFAEYIEEKLPLEKYPKLLEVGCGKTARLARILTGRGYKVTAIDPKVDSDCCEGDGIYCIKDNFDWESFRLLEYDAVVAQEPCEATEHIVRACIEKQKDFVIALCGVPHKLLCGEQPADTYSWYQYLKDIGGNKCVLTDEKLIAGYNNYVLYMISI